MKKAAIFEYIPKRYLRRASFEQKDTNRMILGFKDGRNVYSRWAARMFARALAMTDLHNVTVVCIPASSPCAHVRRWKRFSQELCERTGAINGFDNVTVKGSRRRAHVTGDYELASNIKHCVHIDADFFRGRKVIVIDDIYTTGLSSRSFIAAMESAGADVVLAMFLAKTRQHR